jgi:uncharacterized membrane protein
VTQLGRVLRHLCTTRWSARRHFTRRVLEDIEAAIREVEARHSGEIRFAVEAALDPMELWAKRTPRERAFQAFAHLRVWDTEQNNGVLVYVLLADRDVEIVADRGIAARVPQAEWQAICREIEQHYAQGRFGPGSVAGILSIGRLLARHFPGDRGDADELSNQPILL